MKLKNIIKKWGYLLKFLLKDVLLSILLYYYFKYIIRLSVNFSVIYFIIFEFIKFIFYTEIEDPISVIFSICGWILGLRYYNRIIVFISLVLVILLLLINKHILLNSSNRKYCFLKLKEKLVLMFLILGYISNFLFGITKFYSSHEYEFLACISIYSTKNETSDDLDDKINFWNESSIRMRKEVLIKWACYEKENLNLPDDIKIVYVNFEDFHLGSFFPDISNTIFINKDLLKDKDWRQACEVTSHEIFHIYQDYCVKSDNKDIDSRVSLWKKNYQKYYSSDSSSYDLYRSQPIERDAFDFSSRRILTFYLQNLND